MCHWSARGYIRPVGQGRGSGFTREWPQEEIAIAQMMARLVAAGLPPGLAEQVARYGPEIAPGVRVEVA